MASIQERFEAKFEPVPWSGCWIWIGATGGPDRYGMMRAGDHNEQAHRISWELYRGAIPNGLCVCHRCDVGLCVNPDHLFLATQKENVADMLSKGRKIIGLSGQHGNHAKGEWNGQAKITYAEAKEMQTRYDAGERNIAALSRAFDMSESQTRRIVWRQSWRHGDGK